MLKSCVKAVGKLCKSLAQTRQFYSVSTADFIYLSIRGGFMRLVKTAYEQSLIVNAQQKFIISNLLSPGFYTLSTRPMNTTKLIKE
jgi:hypothetical protein